MDSTELLRLRCGEEIPDINSGESLNLCCLSSGCGGRLAVDECPKYTPNIPIGLKTPVSGLPSLSYRHTHMTFSSPTVSKEVLLTMKEIPPVGHTDMSIKAGQVPPPYASVAAFSSKVVRAIQYYSANCNLIYI